MTVAAIIAGLLPIMFGGGTGSEVMQRIAAPMVGGMITAPLLSMFVIPAAYLLMQGRKVGRKKPAGARRSMMSPTVWNHADQETDRHQALGNHKSSSQS
jgi:hypothetical protein